MENNEANQTYNTCHPCQLAGTRNCSEFDLCGNGKSYPIELRHMVEKNHLNNVPLSITAEQSYNLGNDHAQQKQEAFIKLIEDRIKELENNPYRLTQSKVRVTELTYLLSKSKAL